MPITPQERIKIPVAEALDNLRELALDDRRRISPSVTTARPASSCRRITASAAASSTHLNSGASILPRSCLKKLARPEEATHDVSARRDHGANLREAPLSCRVARSCM